MEFISRISNRCTVDKQGLLTDRDQPRRAEDFFAAAQQVCRNQLSDTTNGVSTGYSYDDNDRLLSRGVTSFTYDANGSTISEADGLNLNTYSYDSRNKRKSVDVLLLSNVDKGTKTPQSTHIIAFTLH